MIRMNKTCKILPVLILTFLILPSLLFAGQYKVVRVVDGDTVVITYQGKLEKVRMLCVNTPESVHPDKKQNIPMGKTASNYTKKRLKGRYVDLEFEGPLGGGYGRLFCLFYY
jgi:micrococcal nuclease